MTLVDRQKISCPKTSSSEINWQIEAVQADAFDWLSHCEPADCIVANLFLHHFDEGNLSRLLCLAASKTRVFVACEPRRTSLGVFGTKLLWAIGCNEVTQHDAQVSVRAGFRDQELSELWPKTGDWKTSEGDRGIFSHRFVAARL